MRIISYNVNGLRAYLGKDLGMFELRSNYDPDILCLQEVKSNDILVSNKLNSYFSEGSIKTCSNNWKSGYAGVSTCTKFPSINQIALDLMTEYGEGRLVCTQITSDVILVNVYVMNSGSGKEELRNEFDHKFNDYLKELRSKGFKVIICGDLNTCLTEKDHWSGYKGRFDEFKNTGPGLYDFERYNLSELIRDNNLVNVMDRITGIDYMTWFRYTDHDEKYGWRLDYFLLDSDLIDKVSLVDVCRDLRYSDHRPIMLDIDIN